MNPYIDPVGEGISQQVCIHNEVFTAMLMADILCGYQRFKFNPSLWDLTGTAADLFEIIPNLADRYRPQDTYKLERDINPNIVVNKLNSYDVSYTKIFTFTMEKDSQVTLKIEALFNMMIKPQCKTPECKEVICTRENVVVKDIKVAQYLDPLAKVVVKQLVETEAKLMNKGPLISGSLPIPAPYIAASNLELKEKGLCFTFH